MIPDRDPSPSPVLRIPPRMLNDVDLVAADNASRGLPAAVADFPYRLDGPSVQLSTFLLFITRVLDAVSATTANSK